MVLLELWSVREATYVTAAYPLANPVELHLRVEFGILKDYSNIKNNIAEASNDASNIGRALKGLSEHQVQDAIIGAKLFAETLSEVGEDNMKWLSKKIEAAQRVLYIGNIKSVSSDEDENA